MLSTHDLCEHVRYFPWDSFLRQEFVTRARGLRWRRKCRRRACGRLRKMSVPIKNTCIIDILARLSMCMLSGFNRHKSRRTLVTGGALVCIVDYQNLLA